MFSQILIATEALQASWDQETVAYVIGYCSLPELQNRLQSAVDEFSNALVGKAVVSVRLAKKQGQLYLESIKGLLCLASWKYLLEEPAQHGAARVYLELEE